MKYKKVHGGTAPFVPRAYILVGRGGDFWCQLEGTSEPRAQVAIRAAIARAAADGGPDPVFPVSLVCSPDLAPEPVPIAVVDTDKAIGTLPAGFVGLGTALGWYRAAGLCLARAFDDGDHLGLRLNLDRVYSVTAGVANA